MPLGYPPHRDAPNPYGEQPAQRLGSSTRQPSHGRPATSAPPQPPSVGNNGARHPWPPQAPRRSNDRPRDLVASARSRQPRQPRGAFPGNTPVPSRTDPSLYEWDRLTTAQQQAVLRTIRLSQRGGKSRVARVAVVVVVILALMAAFALVALSVFHLGGFSGISL